jgi:hypothetical protein
LVLTLLSILGILGSTVRETTVDEMVARSEFIFEGIVAAVEARPESGSRLIHTFVTFQILDVMKGAPAAPTIELRFLGGTVGERGVSVSDLKLPRLGEHGIYFVESLSRRQVNPLFGWSQGHLVVVRDRDGRPRVCAHDRTPIVAVEASPAGATARSSAGIARGLEVGEPGLIETAVGLDAFKREVRRRVTGPAP